MAKVDPRSPEAIRLYMLASAAVTSFLLTYFLVVPILKNTCTWFTARCARVTVQVGKNNTLLVSAPPYTYYYDGVQFIYAYGDNLAGTCPQVIVSGVQSTPVISPPIDSFCFRWRQTPNDPACLAGDDSKCAVCEGSPPTLSAGGVCARAAEPVAGTDQFTCDGQTKLDLQACCNFIPPCPGGEQCLLAVPATRGADGKFSCEKGTLDGDVCNTVPVYDKGTKKFTCDGKKFTEEPECCACTAAFQQVTYPGKTDAVNMYEPVFAVNAQTMSLVPENNGVLCGLNKNIALEQFKGVAEQDVKVKLPVKNATLDIYQVFRVLEKTGVFRRPK
jgi:hypothetical protein